MVCDVCEREMPLRYETGSRIDYRKADTVRVVRRVERSWWWHRKRDADWEPEHVCSECWPVMVEAARAAASEESR